MKDVSLELVVNINTDVTVDVHIYDLIHAVTQLEGIHFYNCMARIITAVAERDPGEISPDHKKILVDYLNRQLAKLNEPVK